MYNRIFVLRENTIANATIHAIMGHFVFGFCVMEYTYTVFNGTWI